VPHGESTREYPLDRCPPMSIRVLPYFVRAKPAFDPEEAKLGVLLCN
jgi:hypothetical protein